MSSAHIDQQTTEYLDGTLSVALIQKVKSHIIFCNACRQYLNQIESNISHLKMLAKCNPPKNFKSEILSNILNPANDKIRSDTEQSVTNTPATTANKPFPIKAVATFAALLIVLAAVLSRRFFIASDRAADNKTQTKHVAPLTPVEKPLEPLPDKVTDAVPVKSVSLIDQIPSKSASIKKEMPAEPKEIPIVKKTQAPVTPVAPVAPAPIKSAPLSVLSGGSSGISDERTVVLSNDKAWTDFWAEHVKNQKTAPTRPEVDLNENEIIAVFGGNQPSAGYSIKVKKIQETSWEGRPARVVYYWIQKPASGAITASVISQPFYLKAVKRLPGKTYFKKLTQ